MSEQSGGNIDHETVQSLYKARSLEGRRVSHEVYGDGTVKKGKKHRRALVDFDEKHNPVDVSLCILALSQEGDA